MCDDDEPGNGTIFRPGGDSKKWGEEWKSVSESITQRVFNTMGGLQKGGSEASAEGILIKLNKIVLPVAI